MIIFNRHTLNPICLPPPRAPLVPRLLHSNHDRPLYSLGHESTSHYRQIVAVADDSLSAGTVSGLLEHILELYR